MFNLDHGELEVDAEGTTAAKAADAAMISVPAERVKYLRCEILLCNMKYADARYCVLGTDLIDVGAS